MTFFLIAPLSPGPSPIRERGAKQRFSKSLLPLGEGV